MHRYRDGIDIHDMLILRCELLNSMLTLTLETPLTNESIMRSYSPDIPAARFPRGFLHFFEMIFTQLQI